MNDEALRAENERLRTALLEATPAGARDPADLTKHISRITTAATVAGRRGVQLVVDARDFATIQRHYEAYMTQHVVTRDPVARFYGYVVLRSGTGEVPYLVERTTT